MFISPKGNNQSQRVFFFSTKPTNTAPISCQNNGAMYVTYKIIRNVTGSAAEAEIGVRYLNVMQSVPIWITLDEMEHPQPPTPIQTDNITVASFANGAMKQKIYKSRYHFLLAAR